MLLGPYWILKITDKQVRIEMIYSWYSYKVLHRTFCGIKMFDICVYTLGFLDMPTAMAFSIFLSVIGTANGRVSSRLASLHCVFCLCFHMR